MSKYGNRANQAVHPDHTPEHNKHSWLVGRNTLWKSCAYCGCIRHEVKQPDGLYDYMPLNRPTTKEVPLCTLKFKEDQP